MALHWGAVPVEPWSCPGGKGTSAGQSAGSAGAVSYTHLDVYKRQV
ncbi:hypothetical protein [Arthrobacter sp. KBS0703]|nr:hypothetical protein [Arthrobacter sp. KBS0703]